MTDSVSASNEPDAPVSQWGKGRLVIASILVAVLLATGGYIFGRLTAPNPANPTSTSAAAGFARDMQVHHDQAVELSLLVRDLTTDEDIRRLAYDIAITQAHQSGQMYGWLEVWGLPQASPNPAMTWMLLPTIDGSDDDHTDHNGQPHEPGGPMPGMATPAQLAELASLSGVAAELLFLELMIEHHLGGVDMAEAVLARSENPQAEAMATSVVRSQLNEIEYMEQLIADRE